MILSQTYTNQDIVRWLGVREVQKGHPYVRDVSHLTIGASHVGARVQGTMRSPYQVDISFSTDKAGRTQIAGRCTCPVSYGCKHVAATLLAVLENRGHAHQINPAVLTWIESFRLALGAPEKKTGKPAQSVERLFYILEQMPYAGTFAISMLKGRLAPDGGPAPSAVAWSNVERALLQAPAFVDEDDLAILRLLWMQRGNQPTHAGFPLAGRHEDELLQLLLASGRFLHMEKTPNHWTRSKSLIPLMEGRPHSASLEWRTLEDSGMVPVVLGNESDEVMRLQGGLYYVDGDSGLIGKLDLPYPNELVVHLLSLPPLREVDVPVVSAALHELAPGLPAPAPVAARLRVVECEPQPVLSLDTSAPVWLSGFRSYPYGTCRLDYARLTFRYGEFTFQAGDTREFMSTPKGETVRVKRDEEAERLAMRKLGTLGFSRPPAHVTSAVDFPHEAYLLDSESQWPIFVTQTAPLLRDDGWVVAIPKHFRHLMLEVSSWEADLSEDGSGWFNLDMGIVVEGRTVPLAPLLYELFQHDSRWLDPGSLKNMPDAEPVTLALPDGGRVSVPAGRIKPLALVLVDLFDSRPGGSLRLPRLDAPRLDELAGAAGWNVSGAEKVRELAQQLKHGIEAVSPPAGLALQLRPYQLEGLAWLQHLRKHELGGILADDMGLGKTAQTLAHLLLEKEAGRLDRPALIVLPTSLIFNWKREAERFAPDLKVLSLHGKDRAERFSGIPAHDVALTTYPLLWRDEEEIARHDYHLLILDEAQTVKNAASRAAQVVRRLSARHRLCLTGTPLENHLGELWAQFDFLLPGFLGDSRQFTKTWRNPVEKQGDRLRAQLLARRIKPFILRRRKEDVAKELPPKTIIVRNVELEGGQRDLYETVRSAMDMKVREEIAAKGFARSHIVILDALLKLRQVCCDPRLLKIEGAKNVKERAKLDLLMDMLPELVDEGRRVLVFSQFTSMLALVEKELLRAKLGYVLLTGDTQDREGVIRSFQDGEVPIFLISLKAGGVGLNLTAADTVIHFDPWWNPAAENQATDRAHRIGQTRKVFVYKLVVAGSIEEKILALQEKKADLAAGILSEDASGLTKFNESDIAALLAPLPEENRKK